MLIYLNVLCIAINAFVTSWAGTATGKYINLIACLMNMAAVIQYIATKTV